jgi:hypothetical protein
MEPYMRLLAMLLFFPVSVIAAPFLVSDVDPTGAADKCVYQIGTATPVETNTVVVAPALTGSCRIDLASFPAGNNSIQVWFKSSLWGVESAKRPFAFSRPAAGGTGPQNLRIEP